MTNVISTKKYLLSSLLIFMKIQFENILFIKLVQHTNQIR